jgi:ligand-binding SRPBCC domain-containing protein
MRAGQLIEYRISVFPAIWMRWVTEIRHVRDGEYFVDEQRFGPYSFWYHEHSFEPVDGGVSMTDHVTYRVGYGPLGWLAHQLIIRPKLERIFDYRAEATRRLFESSPP